MKKVLPIIFVLALALFLVSAVSAARRNHKVSGDGILYLEGGFEKLEFVAKINKNGKLKGYGDFQKNVLVPWSSHWEPTCLSVDGNTAWIGYTTTQVTIPIPPEYFETTMQLQVTDQGTRISIAVPTSSLPEKNLGQDCNDQGDFFGTVESNVWQGKFKIR